MTEHLLKTWPNCFEAVRFGRKRFEWRRDDRGFEVGDILVLKRWDPAKGLLGGGFVDYNDQSYENTLRVRVTYIARGLFDIPHGFCIMSIEHEMPAVKEP